MYFAIYEGKPYAIVGGKFHPCAIFESGYRIGATPLSIAAKGYFSEQEIKAKLGFKGGELSSFAVVAKKIAPAIPEVIPEVIPEPKKEAPKAGAKATAAVTRKR